MLAGSDKTVAAAGTAERLVSASTHAFSITVRAKASNTGDVYVGESDVSNTQPGIAPGDSVSIVAPSIGGSQVQFELRELWVDVAIAGEGVDFWYQPAK